MRQFISKFLFATIVLLTACNGDDIIPQRDMVRILKKIYITDAVVNVSERQKLRGKDTVEYYEPILEMYGYTTAQFDSSIKYYSKHAEEFDEILDRVIIELSDLEEKTLAMREMDDDSVGSPIDSTKNLWPLKNYWDMAIDHHSNPSLGFDIPVKKLGRYVISFDAQIFPDDQSEDTRMYVFFYFDDNTTDGNRSKDVYHTYLKDGAVHSIEYTLDLDTSSVTHISGWLYDHGGERKDLKRHALFSNIKVNFKPSIPDSIIAPLKKKFSPKKFKTTKKLLPAER